MELRRQFTELRSERRPTVPLIPAKAGIQNWQ